MPTEPRPGFEPGTFGYPEIIVNLTRPTLHQSELPGLRDYLRQRLKNFSRLIKLEKTTGSFKSVEELPELKCPGRDLNPGSTAREAVILSASCS